MLHVLQARHVMLRKLSKSVSGAERREGREAGGGLVLSSLMRAYHTALP